MKTKLLNMLLIICLAIIPNMSYASVDIDKDTDEITIKDYKIEQLIKKGEKTPKYIENNTEFSIIIYPDNLNYEVLSNYMFKITPNDYFEVISSRVEKTNDKNQAIIIFNLKALTRLDKSSYPVEILGAKIKDNLKLKTDIAFKDVEFREEKNNKESDKSSSQNTNNKTNPNKKGDNLTMDNTEKSNISKETILNQSSDLSGETSNPSIKNKPKLIIDNYSLEPKMVEAGKEFNLNMSFYNTNSTYSVRNIKISLNNETGGSGTNGETVGGSVFIPVGSSNTFYISKIAPGKTASKSMRMSVVPNAQAQNYVITATFEYEDKDGNEFTANEIIGIPVVQQAKVSFGEIVSSTVSAGEPAMIDMDFFNTGKDTLSNFMISVQGEGFTVDGSANYYVGNFVPGSSDHFSVSVVPNEPGNIKGKLLITYEDSTGQSHTEEKDFSLEATEVIEETEVPMDVQDSRIMGGTNTLSIISILVIIIAIAIAIIVKKRRNRKKKGIDLQL